MLPKRLAGLLLAGTVAATALAGAAQAEPYPYDRHGYDHHRHGYDHYERHYDHRYDRPPHSHWDHYGYQPPGYYR